MNTKSLYWIIGLLSIMLLYSFYNINENNQRIAVLEGKVSDLYWTDRDNFKMLQETIKESKKVHEHLFHDIPYKRE